MTTERRIPKAERDLDVTIIDYFLTIPPIDLGQPTQHPWRYVSLGELNLLGEPRSVSTCLRELEEEQVVIRNYGRNPGWTLDSTSYNYGCRQKGEISYPAIELVGILLASTIKADDLQAEIRKLVSEIRMTELLFPNDLLLNEITTEGLQNAWQQRRGIKPAEENLLNFIERQIKAIKRLTDLASKAGISPKEHLVEHDYLEQLKKKLQQESQYVAMKTNKRLTDIDPEVLLQAIRNIRL